ncbi:hypothetical protein DUNSADRAFT_12338, partial [Dunaliella salina]
MQDSVIEGMMKRLGLSPFAHVKVGGICGITRLVQLKLNQLGVNFVPMEDKIRKEAENVATGRPVKNSSIFSPDKEWLLWGQCLDAMGRTCAKTQTNFKCVYAWVHECVWPHMCVLRGHP